MFLSTASTMFLSTAYLCLKGSSDLPSLLPTRECLDMAKQKNRRVRLLCKGLEQFREALYAEPVMDATSKQDESVPSAANSVAEATPDKESIVSAGPTADQTTRSSVKKPCKFYAADGGELFKTLFPENTPPTSPGSVASSSTAVGPSSRKVSPSDIKDFAYPSSDEHQVLESTPIIAESTRKQLFKQLKKMETAEKKDSRKLVKLAAKNEALNAKITSADATVRNRDAQTELAKTYANAMILSNTVLRQVVLDVGQQVRSENNGNLKEEALQEHLRIMDALHAGAHSGMARLENHSAGQGRDTTDKVQPKAKVEESEVSNALEIRRPNTVANLEDAKSANRNILKDHKQQQIKTEGHPAEEITEQGEANLEIIPADLHRKESAVREGQENLNTMATTSEDSVPGGLEWSKSSGEDLVFEANRGSSPPEADHLGPEYDGDDAVLHTIANISEDSVPGDLEWPKFSGEDRVFGANRDSSSPSEIEDLGPEYDGDDAVTQKPTEDALAIHNDAQGTDSIVECGINATYEFLDPAGPATMWGILQSNQVGRMGPEGDNDNDKDVQGANSIGKGDINVIDGPSGPATLWGILQSNQTIGEFETESNHNETTTQEPISDFIYDQGTDCGRGEEVGATYELSGAAGPATMWGILQSNEHVTEMGPEGDHDDDHKHVEETNGDAYINYEFLEPAGPATMWGILQSNQTTEEIDPEGDYTNGTAPQDPIADENELVDQVKAVDNGCEDARSQVHEFSEPSGAATLWGILQSNQDEFSLPTGPAPPCETLQSSEDGFAEPSDSATLYGTLQSDQDEFAEPKDFALRCGEVHSNQDESAEPTEPATLCGTFQSSHEEVKENSALTSEEPSLASESNESPTIQEQGAQELGTQEPEVEGLTTGLDQEEGHTQSKADAGEAAAPEAGGPSPEESEITVSGAHGSLDEPQGDSEIETSTSHEVASTLVVNIQGDFGNEGKFAEQGTANGDGLRIQPESKETTIVQGQGDSGLIDVPLDHESFVPLDKENDLSLTELEEEIITPATSPDTAGNSDVQFPEEIGGKPLPSSDQPATSTQPARTHSLPEPEVFEFPCAIPKPKSEAEIKAEKKKAEHKRYKAKKKAEAAAKRRLKGKEEEVAEEELAEEVEAPEPPKTLAQSQAEEDARLGDRRLKQQAMRQEQQDRAASLRGLVRSSRAHLIY
ncbi:hypothetical protein BDR22DRAFT_885485 [Usnea florida]